MHLVQFNTVEHFKNTHSHLSNSLWKFLLKPLFIYNVLLPFNLKSFIPFIHRCLSKSYRCNFMPLQTLKCDVNSKANNSNLKRYIKWQLLQIFEELSKHDICIKYYEMSRWEGEASATLPNINYNQTDIEMYPAVTCHLNREVE